MSETAAKNMIVKKFDIPDVPEDNVKIEIHGGKITVSPATNTADEHDASAHHVHLRETFSRRLNIPPGVKDEDIKATMSDGVLTVTMPAGQSEMPDSARPTVL